MYLPRDCNANILQAGVRAVRCFFDYRESGPCSPFGATLLQLSIANDVSEKATSKAFAEGVGELAGESASVGSDGPEALLHAPAWTRVETSEQGVPHGPPVGRAAAHWQSHWPAPSPADPPPGRSRHGRRLIGGEVRRRQRAEAALAFDESVVPCHSWVPPAERPPAEQ